jgi:molybdopterin/thiamine biosynthesis adenylyltransferase
VLLWPSISREETLDSYRTLFERNYGIFTEKEQSRLKAAKILIAGCGGIGGTVAIILARSGVENFILIEPDRYEPSNMNRQICCFENTIGINKAEAVAEHIKRINPEAHIELYDRRLDHEEISDLIKKVDVVFPAADDFAFSLIMFRDAQRLGKPALLIVPSGSWGHVSIIMPYSPPVEDIEGVPKLVTYEELKEMFNTPRYKFGTYFYVPVASWQIDYYRRFVFEGAPPTQLCPIVWTCSSIGAMEIVKTITGKWKAVTSPRYYSITHKRIKVQRINGISLTTLLIWQRKLMYKIFQTKFGPFLELGQKAWWLAFRKLYGHIERKRNGLI